MAGGQGPQHLVRSASLIMIHSGSLSGPAARPYPAGLARLLTDGPYARRLAVSKDLFTNEGLMTLQIAPA